MESRLSKLRELKVFLRLAGESDGLNRSDEERPRSTGGLCRAWHKTNELVLRISSYSSN